MPELAPNLTSSIMGMPLPFSNGEYKRRIDAVRKNMAAEKLDAVLLYHQESMFYLFGYDQIGYYIYATAVVTADSPDIVVLCRGFDHGMIAGLPYVKDVRHWQDDSAIGPGGEAIEMLRDLQLLKPGKRIGIELGSQAWRDVEDSRTAHVADLCTALRRAHCEAVHFSSRRWPCFNPER